MLGLRGCAGLELTRGRFCCAVSIHHRLAEKDRLQISDLYGENLLLMHRGWSHYVDPLLKVIPVEWEHNIPYGILHPPEPTPTVRRFLDAAKAVSRELYR